MYANQKKSRLAGPGNSAVPIHRLRAAQKPRKVTRRSMRPMRKGSFCALLLVGMLSALCWPAAAQVKVWQGTMTLPTYEEGSPDPNPPFDIYQTSRFNYPYTLRTNLTGVKADHAWRAIFLENEYLKCTVLPDIGGHLYTCMDKISGQPMF